MKRKNIFLLIVLLLFASIVLAQDRKELKTPNMVQALNAFNNNDYAEMTRFLQAELFQNSKNGYAYSQLAYVYLLYEEYGDALEMSNLALRYLPKKDKSFISFAYNIRADVYYGLEDYASAEKDYTAAIKATPEEANVYLERGDFYYKVGKYDLSDKDFQKVVSLAPNKTRGYMGLGRNAVLRRQYNDAIAQFNKAIMLQGGDESLPYSFRAECYMALGRFDEAASDIVKALNIDGDDKAFDLMQVLADSSLLAINSCLNIQRHNEPNKAYWPYCQGVVNEHVNNISRAIELYKMALKINPDVTIVKRIAECYSTMGDYPNAVAYAKRAVETDSTDISCRISLANIYYDMGRPDEAVNEMSKVIKLQPSFFYGYYRRGFFYDNMLRVDEAIENYTAAIGLEPQYFYSYLGRADMFMLQGKVELARKDYQKVVELDTTPSPNSCAQYAFLALGQKERAIEFNQAILDRYSQRPNVYYDAACLYARMGLYEQSMDYLVTAFDKGFTRIEHIMRDNDLNPLKERDEFKRLIDEYGKRMDVNAADDNTMIISIEKTEEIPFRRRNGLTEVDCSINGLPLYFIFDTGASDVTISSVEAAFMLKNGYLTSKDVIGKNMYLTAGGDVVEGTVINLNTIELGNLTLTNIRASVVKGQKAPLLLGQSVLNRLGKIEINNAEHIIKVTYQEY